MKSVGIITINDNNNYGNRLQNYAIQKTLEKMNFKVVTLKNTITLNTKRKYIFRKLKFIKNNLSKKIKSERLNLFNKFNENIYFSSKYITAYSNLKNKYDYFLVGSDQVWNPNFGRLREVDLLNFANNNQKISFSASFGINELPEYYKNSAKSEFEKFKAISVREDAGKKIIEDLTGREDVKVLIDPTMLLSENEWDKVKCKPRQLVKEQYILNYFLGEMSEDWKNEINRVAIENNCRVINLLDKNDPFYQTGPSEFLYLEKNAFMVCTDSFHSSVFSIIYDTPFVVFDRKQKGVVSMNSRIDTLLSKFELQNRRFTGKITEELLKCDYTEAKKILEKEKEKSINFLKKALDINEGANNEQ